MKTINECLKALDVANRAVWEAKAELDDAKHELVKVLIEKGATDCLTPLTGRTRQAARYERERDR